MDTKYEPVIGLEIHCELKTRTKMFCGCLNNPDEKHPNENICPICVGHPGTLPVINKKAVEAVVKVGLALGSEIAKEAKFDRKNYFYPDLPKGYQISQYDKPLCLGGEMAPPVGGGEDKVAITRVHLEEDTGRLSHAADDYSLVDFNRAGVPLMELVTEPDIRSSDEAKKFCEELRLLLRYLGVSEANMEKGEMRCEANISLRKKGASEFGMKVEVKNLNSFKAVERAIEYEIERQTKLLENGEKVIQETRGWDDAGQKTFSQRTKEAAHDYRYFPEPDLPPLKGDFVDFKKIKAEIGELPDQKRARFQKEYGLPEKDVEILVFNPDLADYYERVVSELSEWFSSEKVKGKEKEAKQLTANYLLTDLRKLLNKTAGSAGELLISPENFAEMITLIAEGKISSAGAKTVLEEMFRTGADPSMIIEAKNLAQESGEAELKKAAEEIIAKNEKAIADFKAGQANALQFLVGQMMAKTKGRANPQIAAKVLKKLLTEN